MDTQYLLDADAHVIPAAEADAALLNGHMCSHCSQNSPPHAAEADAALLNGHIPARLLGKLDVAAAEADAALLNGHQIMGVLSWPRPEPRRPTRRC